ncbi:MAG: hypothetical protein E7Z77_01895 [Methanobrevibacter sp.]|uniref:hypothetical protein n=1 Tax=Methanobrevibacter sp. TaxID=66852 RepID=UPI0025F7F197|nr:hypothetical protein [Methanobrevibacter sp.]MBE6508144.1 hypothetical protein [Methanobrevibacter sp.]
MTWDINTKEERRKSALRTLLVCGASIPISMIILYIFFKDINKCLFVLLGIIVLTIYYTIVIYKGDWVDRKIGIYDPNFNGASYQSGNLLLFSFYLGFSIAVFGFGLIESGITSAVGFSFAVLFVGILTLWRTNVFNNNSRILVSEDIFGNKYCKKVLGYHPVFFWVPLMGTALMLGMALHNFLDSILYNTIPLLNTTICVILSLLICYIAVSPHIANKYFPFEIRTASGLIKFIIVILCLMAVGSILITIAKGF